MAELSERHEVRLRGRDKTIYFIADSDDGRLIIRQESEGQKPKDVCSITLSDPDELRGFFKGLRRIMTSLGVSVDSSPEPPPQRRQALAAPAPRAEEPEREEMVAAARVRNAQAFAPWSKDEEQEVLRRFKAGDSVETIAKARKRSVRAIELRLQRLGALPPS
jgi:hypothetical protein